MQLQNVQEATDNTFNGRGLSVLRTNIPKYQPQRRDKSGEISQNHRMVYQKQGSTSQKLERIVIIIIIVTANRPDIIIKNKKEKTCTLIDVEILADRNVVQKEAEKKLKYKSLCIEIQRMWNLKCTVVPVIIGATGIVTRSLKKNLETIPGKHSIDSLQKNSYTWNITHNTESTAM